MVVCRATLGIDHSDGFARPNRKAKGEGRSQWVLKPPCDAVAW